MDIQPVFLSELAAQPGHLLLICEDEAAFARLSDMIIDAGPELGIISDDFPLLVNLTALENIALGCMYHNNMSLPACQESIQPMLDRLNLGGSLHQRPEFLSRPLRLKAQLLRCIANGSTHVYLPAASRADCDILDRALRTLDTDVFLWVASLSSHLDHYTSLEYTVIDLKTLQ